MNNKTKQSVTNQIIKEQQQILKEKVGPILEQLKDIEGIDGFIASVALSAKVTDAEKELMKKEGNRVLLINISIVNQMDIPISLDSIILMFQSLSQRVLNALEFPQKIYTLILLLKRLKEALDNLAGTAGYKDIHTPEYLDKLIESIKNQKGGIS